MTRPDPPRLEVTVLDRLISVAMWIIALCWMVPLMATMMVVALVVPSDRTQWLTRLYCGGQVRLTGARWRAVVDPAIDTETPYIFCCNHVNLLDHVTMYNSTPHFKQGVELASHFDIPVYGWFMKQRGTIPVHRGQGAVDRLRVDVRREIDAGHSVLVFPEGTRTVSGRVGSFRKGLFRIARDLDVQVVRRPRDVHRGVFLLGGRLTVPGALDLKLSGVCAHCLSIPPPQVRSTPALLT